MQITSQIRYCYDETHQCEVASHEEHSNGCVDIFTVSHDEQQYTFQVPLLYGYDESLAASLAAIGEK